MKDITKFCIKQSKLQKGFTAGSSSIVAVLILSECITNQRIPFFTKSRLYVTTLDAQKAFDVVDQELLLRKLYLDDLVAATELISYEVVGFNSSLISAVCAENIRTKTVTIRTKNKPWMCNEVRYLLRKRVRCFKKYKRTLSEQDKFYFYLARLEVNRPRKNAKKMFENKMMTSFSKPNLSTSEVWKLSKRILGDKSDRTISPLWHNLAHVSEDKEKSDLFSNYFTSISSIDVEGGPPQLPVFGSVCSKQTSFGLWFRFETSFMHYNKCIIE